MVNLKQDLIEFIILMFIFSTSIYTVYTFLQTKKDIKELKTTTTSCVVSKQNN